MQRRDFVRIGGLTALGLGVADVLRGRDWCHAGETAEKRSPRAKHVILIWLDGGPSHLETFDPKPDAPREVRGPLGVIKTDVSGIALSECLPRTAALMSKLAIVRSLTSPLGEHNFAAQYALTGYLPSTVIEYPTYGCVVSQLRKQGSVLPPFVAVPNFKVGGANLRPQGYLPASTAPFSVGGDPAKPDFRVQNLDFYVGVNAERLERRREYLQHIDRFARAIDEGDRQLADPHIEQAFRLASSREAKEAFRLEAEPAAVRQRYGARSIGQSCLLARRLVERGVSFVTVNNTGWDTHESLYTRLKEGYTGAKVPVGLVPSLDLALSALVEDLAERGLLDETLVLVMGEFGRTPKLNTAGGRDHWPRVFSAVLAGAGIPGGQVIGASDATGESPQDRPVTPADLAATVYTLMGIDPRQKLLTPDGRPMEVNRGGVVVRELMGIS